jgi:Kef-type K+ transport system membrane component KefB
MFQQPMTGFYSLLILMVVIWTAGMIFRRIGLPEVFGELAGGILVGPAVLGWVPAESEVISVLAELGIFFLMLHAGLKTEPEELASASRDALLVALGGILLPFGLGMLVGWLFGMSLTAMLFTGLALSISAIPLGVRLIKDCNLEGTRLAHTTIGAAIIDDIAALIGFSLLIGFLEHGSFDPLGLLIVLAKVIAFFAVLMFIGSVSKRYLSRIFVPGNRSFTITLIAALGIGLIGELLGLHMIIGAFFAGLFIRREVIDPKVYDKIEDRYFAMSYGLFGPIFFASLAFHLDTAVLWSAPLLLLAVTAAAIIGKVIGCGSAALSTGLSMRESLFTGLAMNNRGSVELVIASLALQYGAINDTLFSVIVLMAFITTIFSILTATPVARSLTMKHTVTA